MSRRTSYMVFATMALFFACFFVAPIWTTLRVAFADAHGGFTMDHIWEVFRNPLYREGLWNSFLLGVFSTLGCVLLGLPLALIYTRYDFPGKSAFNSLLLLPMIIPPFVGAIGVRAMMGQAGAFNSLLIKLGLMSAEHPVDWLGNSQMTGMIILNVLTRFPILYLNATAALANLDPALEEAAANLGCKPAARFRKIILPLIMPGVFAGGTIVFIWSFTDLGVPLVFDFDRVTAVQIFNLLKDISGNALPYALVVVMLVFTVLCYALSKMLFERGNAAGGGRAVTGRETIKLPTGATWLCTLLFVVTIGVISLPHLGVLLLSVSTDWYRTVLPEGFTLQHYREVLSYDLTLRAIANSVKYATLATLLDLVLGVSVAYVCVRTKIWGRQILDAMAMLPLAVPGLVMAFGYLAMAREGEGFHFLMIGENPAILLIIAYAVRRLPYVVRSASAGFQQINPALEDAAQNLGASPLKALGKITLPLIAPNLIAGGLLAFSFAMLEVSDSMILAQQAAHFPITKAIYQLVSSLGNGPFLAAALGVWAMVFLGITLIGAGMMLGKKLGAMFRG
ncbi:MAG: iron ABC transporter permease [Verrucomicrobia bacterium]|nr:iron ABC transporter permease [Verrucomicrobiota bacterium]